MLHEYLDLLDLYTVQEILVLGCGTGVEVRELLAHTDFKGNVTAVDISSNLIKSGKSALTAEAPNANVEWVVADAQSTNLPERKFDLIMATTLISHVPDPAAVLGEIERLIKPDGTAVIFDGDYATMTYGTADANYGREMDEKIISGLIANPRIMRSMPRMLRSCGFKLTDSRGWIMKEIGTANFFLGSLDSLPVLLPNAGVATENEVRDFVTDQRQAHENGEFFAAYNFYAMIAKHI